jgi:hypothetical protein
VNVEETTTVPFLMRLEDMAFVISVYGLGMVTPIFLKDEFRTTY